MTSPNASAFAGTGILARIALHTGWKRLALWVLGLIGMMLVTTASLSALYDTAEKLAAYSQSLDGDAMLVLNGKVAGLETMGGVFANEFGFVLAFGLPLMGIALASRGTRQDEEAGRLELLLAARIGHRAPILAAVLVTGGALLITGLGSAAVMIAFDADVTGSLLYGLGMAALGFVFAGVTVFAAQFFEHNRAVWGFGLAVTVISYLLRGQGAVNDNWLLWLSPHGWVDEARAFGDARAWPLLLAGGVGLGLTAVAFYLNTRRDVGSALIRPRTAAARASRLLRSPVGLAVYEHRGAVLGWSIGTVALMGTYGSLTQEVLNAFRDNPDLAVLVGADPNAADRLLGAVLSTFVMILAILVAAFFVMAVNSLRREEAAARLEADLSGSRSRYGWLGTHVLVIGAGALIIAAAGAVVLATTTASSTGDDTWTGEILSAAVSFSPSVVIFGGIAVALFGARPTWQVFGWVLFAFAAIVAYLGPGFDLPEWLVKASPFAGIGADIINDGASATGTGVLLGTTVALLLVGLVTFRRRNIPAA
ncbi:MAG: hypothetical protein CSA58_05590 [Micrococcales bacterium]|nr:MAG: hypothetical protein CSB46_04045 [Micrococcales bacterium]PIE27184.1 MAG: hypothetical protein CSA58_05590 [Micrococcales bacterium]